ncbi:MFS transporter [Nocardia cyriacigeorgica]|uniref:MFS transporter n=1 Tax=Nocardia cyriacigeorgica TaxID=135487 RepID=UPI001895C141|nr:MFS transporter [Nocardia cyriacigeorgica]MBF6435870.1 MFS transporter [Nocardia cyriacigeorgica]
MSIAHRNPAAPRDSARVPGGLPAVAVLALSTFVVVTSEMLPVGVLTPMSQGVGISTGSTGFSLAITGIVTAITAPLVVRFIAATDRRLVLAAATAVLAVGNLTTALAHGFAVLAAGRVIVGIGMGAVWALASAVAPRLVRPRHAAAAVSTVVGGVAAASVLGVPVGTFVGELAGWRSAFAVLAAVALLLSIALVVALPALPRPADAGAAAGERARLWRVPAVRTGLAAIVSIVTAHFTAFTYVRPALEQLAGLDASAVSTLLLLYGLCGLIGNFAAGAAAARRVRATLLVLVAGVGIALVVLVLAEGSAGAVVALMVWGFAYGGVSVCGQLWMNQAVPQRREQVTGLYVGVFTGSIALGAFAGGLVVDAAGLPPLLWGAVATAAGALLIVALGRSPRQ